MAEKARFFLEIPIEWDNKPLKQTSYFVPIWRFCPDERLYEFFLQAATL